MSLFITGYPKFFRTGNFYGKEKEKEKGKGKGNRCKKMYHFQKQPTKEDGKTYNKFYRLQKQPTKGKSNGLPENRKLTCPAPTVNANIP